MRSLPRRSAKYAATAAAASSASTHSAQAPAGTPSTTCTRASLPQASNKALDVAATRRAVATPCAACKPDPAYAFNRKPAGQRLVHTSQAHHVRHMAFVEQPARRTPQLLARHHHFVANPRAQARLRKLRVAGVARFQRARGAHGRARAASDALRRVHPQLAVHQHDTARRACVGALQARDVAVAHLRAPLLVHHDGLAGHPVQHAHDASVRPQPLARAPVHHSAVFSSMSASTTVLA